MALCIDTFSNSDGGFPFFKAAGHPASAPLIIKLLKRLSKANKVAIYDPLGFANGFFEIYSSNSRFFIEPPIRTLKSDVSKCWIGAMPLLPFRIFFQVSKVLKMEENVLKSRMNILKQK